MSSLSRILAVTLLVVLGACGRADTAITAAPEDEQAARNYVDLLRRGDFDTITRDIDPSMQSAISRGTLEKMASILPAQDPIAVKVVGANTLNAPGVEQNNVALEFQYPEGYVLVGVGLRKANTGTTLAGFSVTPLPDSLANLNSFKFEGRSPLQYTVLILAVIVPLFMIYAVALCAYTPMETWKKAAWIFACVVGVGRFTIDWTFGIWTLKPLSLLLLGTAAYAPPHGAWQISVALPIGAAVFFAWRKHRFGTLKLIVPGTITRTAT